MPVALRTCFAWNVWPIESSGSQRERNSLLKSVRVSMHVAPSAASFTTEYRHTADYDRVFYRLWARNARLFASAPSGGRAFGHIRTEYSGACAIRPSPWRGLSSHAMGSGGVPAGKCLTDFRRAWDGGQVCAFRFFQRQLTLIAGACAGHSERGVCQYFMSLVVGVNPIDAHQLIVLRLG